MPEMTIFVGDGTLQWLEGQAEMCQDETGLPTTPAEMAASLIEWQFNQATQPVEVGDVWTDIDPLEGYEGWSNA